MQNGKETPGLLPIVRWSQRKETINLKVELQECKLPNISIKSDSINFRANGVGAKGENFYEFTLEFFKDIDRESSVHKLNGSSVEIALTKDGIGEWWPRLTKNKNPHFLKLDFDKWRSETDDEDELMEKKKADFLEELKMQKELYENRVDLYRKGYLVIYNMIQFLANAYIFFFCIINLVRGGAEIFPLTYDRIGKAVHLVTALSALEAIHPLVGVMKGSWFAPFLQVFGRNAVLFCIWIAADDIGHEWNLTFLFMTWSSIELIRYPLYICQICNIPSKALTWLRYTIWIPLYPFGVLMETISFIGASQVLANNSMYELNLPNAYNAVFKLSWLIRIYIAIHLYAFIFMLIPHMVKMRHRKLGGVKKYKQP